MPPGYCCDGAFAPPNANGEFTGIPDHTNPTCGLAGALICGTVALADKYDSRNEESCGLFTLSSFHS